MRGCSARKSSHLMGLLANSSLLGSTEFLSRLQRGFVVSASEVTSQLAGACLLERLPVVTPDDPEWEREYAAWQEQLHRRYRKELPKEFQESEQAQAEDAAGVRWNPAPRVTTADQTNDTKSLQRKLDRRLFLMLKCKGGSGNGQWELPSRAHSTGETMRQTAELALFDAVTGNPSWKTFFLGNAPCAHWQAPTATTWIHKAQLITGDVSLVPEGVYYDHAWLSREEILEVVSDLNLREIFEKLLPKL